VTPPTEPGAQELLAGLAFAAPEHPAVSVVVPAFDCYEITVACLRAVARETRQELVEVVLVDDCSTDPSFGLLADVTGLVYLRQPENKGFCEAVNRGVAAARAPLVFLLNNDTEVTSGWLEPLLDAIGQPDVGAVGAKLVYPDGRLQEAGSVIWSDATGANIGRGGDPEAPEYNFRREVDYCSAAALLVRRDLFLEIGGFDLAYAPGYYEDTDLCFELWARGHRVLYEPRSVVVHHEGATFGTDENPTGIGQYSKIAQEFNRFRFAAKWTDELLLHHSGSLGGLLEGRRSGAPSVLVVDWCVPVWDQDSGSLRMSWILRLLVAHGCHVTFLPVNGLRPAPYSDVLAGLGVEVWAGHGADAERLLAERRGAVDLVWIARPDIAVTFLERLNLAFPAATFLYDTIDLHQRRADQEQRLGVAPVRERRAKDSLYWIAQAERWAMARADLVATVTEAEAELAQAVGAGRTVVLPNVHEAAREPTAGFSDRSGLLFIGFYGHLPNVDAVQWFTTEVAPLVRRELEVTTWLLGSHPPPEVQGLASADVVVPGYLADVDPYFAGARVFVAPLRYGAGMKGKLGQAMTLGLPVVTTSVGAEGMELVDGEHVLIADTPDAFAEAVLRLHRDEELWSRLSRNAQLLVAERWSPEAMWGRLDDMLRDVAPRARTAARHRRLDRAPARPHVGVPTASWLERLDDTALSALWTVPWGDGAAAGAAAAPLAKAPPVTAPPGTFASLAPLASRPDRLVEWTGERCVPWVDDRQVLYEHLHRYCFAAQLARGKRVLDLGSGEGYGSALLARVAESVFGVDLDEAAVAHATRRYASANLRFERHSVVELDHLPEASFDLVVCFEVIEHIEEHEALLAGVRRLLTPAGVFLVSTPDREVYSEATDYHNPYHVKELSRAEFATLLDGFFAHHALWTQAVLIGSIMQRLDGGGAGAAGQHVVRRAGEGWEQVEGLPAPYLVAVASQGPVPPLPDLSTLHHHEHRDTAHEM
jgi:GT2 family glycosyltransferase/glycosyltransferase involved in cell wall biosynthesis/SAM-dependent methyltransferase